MKPELHALTASRPLPDHIGNDDERHALNRHAAARPFRQLQTRYDPHTRAIWVWMNPSPRPCLNPVLVDDLSRLQKKIKAAYNNAELFEQYPFTHVVLASKTPGVYCLGGDLELFQQLILAQDADRLRQYAHKCVHALYLNTCNLELPITVISLIQGQALGGGFEAALSCDVMIAERHSSMGFPEMLFNLFPGMGAYNLLSRKINPGLAERMILSGASYNAEELYKMGVIDMLVEPGEGVVATEKYLKNRNRAHNTVRHMKLVRRMTHPVTLQNLLEIVDLWVDAAMQLDSRDLMKMNRLIHAQNSLGQRQQKQADIVPIQRRGEWRKQPAQQFPLTTHLGEVIPYNRRTRERCRRQ